MRGKILGVATLSIAASCAVLTVDVDVYKGPMANEPDVQAQQLTAMAVAARPVLIQLRDELEARYRRIKPSGLPEDLLGEDYVLDKEQLKSTQARVVNGVLGLYLDKVDPAIAAFVGKGRDIFEECKRLREQMERFEEDRKLWEKVEKANDPSTHKSLAPLLAPTSKPNLDASDRSIRGPDTLLGVAGKSATTVFMKLADVEAVQTKLATLIPSAKLRQQVARRVAEIAGCYLTGRERLADGLELALSFHVAVSLHRDRLENFDAINESSARLISLLIQPQQLALTPRTQGLGSPWLLPGDRQILNVLPPAPSGTDNWDSQKYEKSARALQGLLEAQPFEVAGAILRIHRWLRDQGAGLSIDGRTSADFRFGLARALTLDGEERAQIVEAFQTFRGTIALLGDVGLDGGRLDDGLLTMIGRYLEARDREHAEGDNDQKTSKRERQRLMDGLVHFAEKLRFLASHEAVFGAANRSFDVYVMALESIGNSILTLANEEQHRRTYERTDQPQKTNKAAIDALNAVTTALAELVKSAEVEEAAGASVSTPSAESNEKEKDAEAAKAAPTKSDSARDKFAAQLAEAQTLVNTAASLAVYIRPPWAYLRNSTPISALQPGEVPVDNLLTDHAHGALLGNGNPSAVKLMAEALNRQFWQNINRVRVAGMGNTSYVLVKDDLGNWYVKGYSADPTPVLEGLQGMALAAQSGAMGMDLFARQDARAKARETNSPVEPVESATMVGKQAKRFEKVYADEAKAASKEAGDAYKKLATDLIAAWEKIPAWTDDNGAPLSDTRNELKDKATAARSTVAEPADDADSPTHAAHVLAVLAGSLELHEEVLTELDEARLVDGGELSRLEKALSDAARALELNKLSVALAEAKLEAIKGVSGVLPGDLKAAEEELAKRKSELASAGQAHEKARAEHESEAKRVAAAKRLVADLRKAVHDVVGAGVKERINARRKSSESYSTALEVLSQSSEPAN